MIEEYLKFRAERGQSPHTLQGARNVLLKFASWLWESQNKRLLEAGEADLETYILSLKDRSLLPRTIAVMTYRIAGLYQFLVKEKTLLIDPTKNFFPLKEEYILKNVPSPKAVEILLNSPDEYTHLGIRDKAILELLYSSGLRKKELQGIRLKDIDLKEGTVKLKECKGGRERMVPIGEKASRLIQKYLETTRRVYLKNQEEAHLFLSITGSAINDHTIHYVLLRYRKRSPITTKITAHSLRHACALHMLQGGAPIHAVQELLGHKKIETTQVYTKLCVNDLKEVLRKFHPRERKT